MAEAHAAIDALLSEHRVFEPPEEFRRWALWNDPAIYERASADPEAFWAEQANAVSWFQKWNQVMEWNPPWVKWFIGGTLNVSYNCLDRHLENGGGDKVAYYWEGEPGEERTITYRELYEEVCRFANGLKALGVKKGDRVAIYLPMIPELVAALLACARIGAPHTVIFGGFAASALRERINDSNAKLVITADGGLRGGKTIELKRIADEAVAEAPTVQTVLVVRRLGTDPSMQQGRDHYLDDLFIDVPQDTVVPCEVMNSEDMLYILYTSGSTGKPKGVVHVQGGYAVGVYATTKFVFDIKPDDVYWCTADIGWVTGHSYIVYGPLMAGATGILFEGTPTYPGPDRFWSVVEKYKATILYTAPTAIRSLMGFGEEPPAQHDLSSLRLLGTVGEPINPEAWMWYRKHIGRNELPIMDTWWQTETGMILISPTPMLPLKPGSATWPLPTIEADVVDKNGHAVGSDKGGFLIVRHPWPAQMRTIYGDPERYRTYWTTIEGVYFAGDAATKDRDGYFRVQGRVDDVIKVSGHRLGSMEIESSLVSHPAAAIGKPDQVKGERIKVFVILKHGVESSEELTKELKRHVRTVVGPLADPDELEYVSSLPKTRSGKIMRRVVRARELGEPVGDISTLEA